MRSWPHFFLRDTMKTRPVCHSGGTEPGWTTCLANRKTINTCNSAMWIAMQASSPLHTHNTLQVRREFAEGTAGFCIGQRPVRYGLGCSFVP
ncbi:Calmodulin-binding transcription activator 1 [Manis javanica]|nr:Calmodulin-binding transcription activator 1 [Manis javanica]